jgi:molybdopterin molybdotransferase
MAQLSDDCFAFGGQLLTVDEAAQLMRDQVPAVAEIETVALDEADGRVTAADVVAPIALPSFDNSAVDGYAVRHADLAADGETRLRIAGRQMAGHPLTQPLKAGEAVRIFTGAPMAEGADTVFMQEDCRIDGDAVIGARGRPRP